MQFFLVSNPGADSDGSPPSPQEFAAVGALIEDGFTNGWLVATGALDPHKIHIKREQGQISVTDGPYSEAKEAVVGWAIVKVESKEAAIELSKRFWSIVGDGSGTIQRIFEPGEVPGSAPDA